MMKPKKCSVIKIKAMNVISQPNTNHKACYWRSSQMCETSGQLGIQNKT